MRASEAHAGDLAPSTSTHGWARLSRWRIADWPALPALIVGLLTAAAAALRVAIVNQGIFGDEMSTYWIVSSHGLRGVISTVHSNAEITPPLYFAASWLTTRIDLSFAMLRLPSLVAGIATIPLVYLLGQRLRGRSVGMLGAALTTLSPFMIYYSTEARAYAVLIFFVVVSTLAMLLALETRRARWWVVYAVASAAAMYTHYTGVFVLLAQFIWVMWVHPRARRPAIVANIGAAILFAPWIGGLLDDLRSPTTEILSALTPFSVGDVAQALGHWAVGYRYPNVPLSEVPGVAALIVLGLALLVAATGFARLGTAGRLRARLAGADSLLVLIVVLAAATPLGELLASVAGTHMLSGRNLAASWPAFALLLSVVLLAAAPPARLLAAGLAIAAFALGAAKMLDPQYARPDVRGVADAISRQATARDVVIDGSVVFTPGPVTPLDTVLGDRFPVVRAGGPQERDHPFGVFDRTVTPSEAVSRAVAVSRGGRIFFVDGVYSKARLRTSLGAKKAAEVREAKLPDSYRLVETERFPGYVAMRLRVFAPR